LKKAAFVSNGPSLSLDELREFDGKIFAMPVACKILEDAGIACQSLGDPLGVRRIYDFGHRDIHLYGFDLCGEGTRICFDNEVYLTTQDQAQHANALLETCLALMQKGATIGVHGNGMFQHMAKNVIAKSQERILTAIYDLQVCPPTYEFFSFISQAEKFRADRGFTAMDVIFLPGPMHGFRDDGLPPSISERRSMLHRICVSGARLVPSVRNVFVMKDRTHIEGDVFPPDWTNEKPRFLYGPQYQKDGHRCLTATQAARDEISHRFDKPFATITLREAEYWPNRNSNREAWERTAREISYRGIVPICIPDTHGRRLRDCKAFEPAAWDIDLRMALYEGAVLNLGVITGPMSILMLAAKPCPYIVFQKPDEESPGTQKEFMAAQGIIEGDNWSENGWTVWGQDDPESIVGALSRWFEKRRAA
jgi:hypothetical protein